MKFLVGYGLDCNFWECCLCLMWINNDFSIRHYDLACECFPIIMHPLGNQMFIWVWTKVNRLSSSWNEELKGWLNTFREISYCGKFLFCNSKIYTSLLSPFNFYNSNFLFCFFFGAWKWNYVHLSFWEYCLVYGLIWWYVWIKMFSFLRYEFQDLKKCHSKSQSLLLLVFL